MIDVQTFSVAYSNLPEFFIPIDDDDDNEDEVHKFIRSVLASLYGDEVAQATRIQYGGSVTPDSVDGLMAMPEIDGCLVGGASLDAGKFGRIINYVK